MIKAIIFDLDDTLFDCTGTLVESARRRAAKAMHDSGFPEKEESLFAQINRLSSEMGAKADVFGELCKKYGLDEPKTIKIIDSAMDAYNSLVVENIQPFDDVIPTLIRLRKTCKLALVTSGAYARQKIKIEKLGLEKYFDIIFIDSDVEGKTKADYFNDVLEKFHVKPHEVLCIGDRITSEIKIGNSLEMTTVQMLFGRHKDIKPKIDLEEPDYRITRISHLFNIIDAISSKKKLISELNIVCIGGGTGMPLVLEGLKKHTKNLTAVVGVTDSGRSSGRLRKDMGILPPGDIRNCLIALSESEQLMNDIFQYRFESGNLTGHSFGNLLIAALTKVTGSFENAINEVSKILNITGSVVPVSLVDTHLCAELKNGEIVIDEDNITKRNLKEKCKNPIKRIFLKEQTPANPRAVEAIRNADCIVFGPGSHYVSLLNNLLHDEIRDAINSNKNAVKIYLCNMVTQPYQTDDYTASDHVKELLKYLKGKIDFVLLNNKWPDKKILKKYEEDHAYIVKSDLAKIKKLGAKPVQSDLVEEITEKRVLFEKRDLLRHDPDKIACEIINLLSKINNNKRSVKKRKSGKRKK